MLTLNLTLTLTLTHGSFQRGRLKARAQAATAPGAGKRARSYARARTTPAPAVQPSARSRTTNRAPACSHSGRWQNSKTTRATQPRSPPPSPPAGSPRPGAHGAPEAGVPVLAGSRARPPAGAHGMLTAVLAAPAAAARGACEPGPWSGSPPGLAAWARSLREAARAAASGAVPSSAAAAVTAHARSQPSTTQPRPPPGRGGGSYCTHTTRAAWRTLPQCTTGVYSTLRRAPNPLLRARDLRLRF